MRLILIFLLLPSILYSQSIKISGYVTDSTGNPLHYVNIVSTSRQEGTVTNAFGYYSIILDQNDSIKYSHIAYKSLVLPANNEGFDTIVLSENLTLIDEVVVRSNISFNTKLKIGFFNQDKNGEFALSSGNQIAVFINNPHKKSALIRSITFLVKNKGECKSQLRLRLLENSKNKMIPGKDLLLDNYIIDNTSLRKSNTIDISKSKVFLPPDGAFVVVEWLSSDEDCEQKSLPSICANLSTKENLVWFNFRDKKWDKPDKRPLPNGNYMTPNVSLLVFYQ